MTGLCRAGQTLNEFLTIATHVIFYGHGEANWWTALPGNPDTELIGSGTVQMLGNHKVYAVCCSSLSGLGTIHSQKCNGSYVGYDNRFRFDFDNEAEFKQIVNQSAFNFVITGNVVQVVTDLKNEWARLANDFAGPLKLRKSAVMAGSFARSNGQRIGSRP